MKRMTVTIRKDIPLAGAERILAELEAAFTLSPSIAMVDVRIHRATTGEAALAVMTVYQQMDVIPAAESDAAWNRHQAPERVVQLPAPPVDVPIFPDGSLRARLATRRRQERTA